MQSLYSVQPLSASPILIFRTNTDWIVLQSCHRLVGASLRNTPYLFKFSPNYYKVSRKSQGWRNPNSIVVLLFLWGRLSIRDLQRLRPRLPSFANCFWPSRLPSCQIKKNKCSANCSELPCEIVIMMRLVRLRPRMMRPSLNIVLSPWDARCQLWPRSKNWPHQIVNIILILIAYLHELTTLHTVLEIGKTIKSSEQRFINW